MKNEKTKIRWNKKTIENLTSEMKHDVSNSYNLSFSQALDKAMNENLFLRSDLMAPGVYLKVDKDTGILMVIDGNKFSMNLGPFQISRNSYTANWKAFPVANPKAINDRPGQYYTDSLEGDDNFSKEDYGVFYTQDDIYGKSGHCYATGSKEQMEEEAKRRNEQIKERLYGTTVSE